MLSFKMFMEALRKRSSPLEQRMIDNMKTPKQIHAEFKDHNDKLSRSTEKTDKKGYDAVGAMFRRYHDPGHVDHHDDKHLKHFASHKIKQDITLFRGHNGKDPLHHWMEHPDRKPGDHGVISGGTSSRHNTAKGWSKNGSVVVIHATKGSRAGHVSGYPELQQYEKDSDDRSENEVLLHKHKFKYLGHHTESDGKKHHHIELVK